VATLGPERHWGSRSALRWARFPAPSLVPMGCTAKVTNAPVYAVTHHPASLMGRHRRGLDGTSRHTVLIDIAGLGSGDTVVIPAASSSVRLAAIQIAKKVGALPVWHLREAG